MMDVYSTVYYDQTGKIYVIGGYDGGAVSPVVQRYDIATDTWDFGEPMPTPRSNLLAGICNGNIHAIGGYDGNLGEFTVNEAYDPLTNTWSVGWSPLPNERSELMTQGTWTGAEIFALGDGMFGVGGKAHNVYTCERGDGSIHGWKWNDLNGDGVYDPGEPGVPGVMITITDMSNNPVWTGTTVEDDPNTDGDEAGWFWAEGLTPGDYIVTEEVPNGWMATTPVSVTVSVQPDQSNSLASHSEFDCGKMLLVANEGNGGDGQTIVAVDCNGNVSPFASGFPGGVSGLAMDPVSGHLFASDNQPGIYEVDMAGSFAQMLPHPTDSVNPNALSVDSVGRLLVGDAGDKVLRVIHSAGAITGVTVLATGFSVPQGVVEDHTTGIIYFTDRDGEVFYIMPTSTLPVVPGTAATLPIGSVAPGNEGTLLIDDADGSLYFSDFNNRIIKVEFGIAGDPTSAVARDVVEITEAACPAGQAGREFMPGFRGFTLDSEGDLIVAFFCLDKIGIFDRSAIANAFITNTPITVLPPPFAQNPGGVLDGILNGPFGLVFTDSGEGPDPDHPHVKFGNKQEQQEGGSIHG